MLDRKKVLLGVTGSIAAYKSAEIARRLMEEGAIVNVVMTGAACRFIPPYTLESITGNHVRTDLFEDSLSHIRIPAETDLFIIAPATANTINKFACGIADNLLTSMWLAYEGKVLIAPAMNCRMYRHPTVTKSIKELKKMNVEFIGPASGNLACGEEGPGRMVEVPDIMEAAVSALTTKDLRGHGMLVTAGPTIEPIDPVRFISNRSSGKMGYAVARAASRRGAEVTLISGPSSLEPPPVHKFVSVERASEMEAAVIKHARKADSVVMAAAVSDYTPSETFKVKYDKNKLNTLKLKKNADILKKLATNRGTYVIVGFAAETGSDIERAREKLKQKNLDIIVFNDVAQEGAGFNVDTNIVTIIDRKGNEKDFPVMKKIEVADIIIDKIMELTLRKKK